MSKTSILIVEDEFIIARSIQDNLIDLGYDILGPVISYSGALASIKEQKPDLAIIDIQLSGKKDGIDLAWKLNEEYNIPFIFLTSNTDTATFERAKSATPLAYLVKPFKRQDLYSSIEIALHNFIQKDDTNAESVIIKDALFFKQDKAFVKIKFDDILFLKSEHVYVEIYTNDEKTTIIRKSLQEYTGVLPDYFLRVHRSYIINTHFLQAINPTSVMVDNHNIPISKIYKDELLNKVKFG